MTGAYQRICGTSARPSGHTHEYSLRLTALVAGFRPLPAWDGWGSSAVELLLLKAKAWWINLTFWIRKITIVRPTVTPSVRNPDVLAFSGPIRWVSSENIRFTILRSLCHEIEWKNRNSSMMHPLDHRFSPENCPYFGANGSQQIADNSRRRGPIFKINFFCLKGIFIR